MIPITLATNFLSLIRNKTVFWIMMGLCGLTLVYQYAYHQGVKSTEMNHTTKLTNLIRQQQLKEQQLFKEIQTLRDAYTVKTEEALSAYEKGKEDANKVTNTILADLRNQSKRLSIEVRTCKTDNAHAKSTTRTKSAKRTDRAELSEDAARFLITQAAKADDVVRRYTLCQTLLDNTRKSFMDYQQKIKRIE